MARLRSRLTSEPTTIAVKIQIMIPIWYLMAAMGMPAGPLRKPQKHLTGAALQRGLDAVTELGLVNAYGYSPVNALGGTLAAAE